MLNNKMGKIMVAEAFLMFGSTGALFEKVDMTDYSEDDFCNIGDILLKDIYLFTNFLKYINEKVNKPCLDMSQDTCINFSYEAVLKAVYIVETYTANMPQFCLDDKNKIFIRN